MLSLFEPFLGILLLDTLFPCMMLLQCFYILVTRDFFNKVIFLLVVQAFFLLLCHIHMKPNKLPFSSTYSNVVHITQKPGMHSACQVGYATRAEPGLLAGHNTITISHLPKWRGRRPGCTTAFFAQARLERTFQSQNSDYTEWAVQL